MSELNWKAWGLGAILVLGLLLEIFKQIPQSSLQWDPENLFTGRKASKPYSAADSLHARDHVRPTPSNTAPSRPIVTAKQIENFLDSQRPAAATTKGTVVAKVEKVAKPKKLCKSRRTGMIHVCKKKKKKDDKPVASDEPIKYYQAPVAKEDTDVDQEINSALTTGALIPFVDDRADTTFESLQDWQRRLLRSPDLKETKRFIDQFQKSLVTAEVFYKITDMMLEDSRSEMKLLGVLCAGVTPSLISFQLLAQVLKTERADSKVRVSADGFLDQYAQGNYLSVLESVLRLPASHSSIVAAQKLERAASALMSKSAPTTDANAARVNAANTQKRTRNAALLQRFVLLLQPLTTAKDRDVADQAQKTLASIQGLLPSTTSLPVAGP